MAGSGPDDRALLGRARELSVFGGLLADLDAGRGCCALIEGEPGIGKTALLEAVLGRARDAGFAVAHGVCREPDRDGPVRALVEALGLSAEWRSTAREREPAAAPVASAVGRVLAAVELRCADGPLVLAVDDLHRADEASLLLWQRLCRSTGSAALMLIATTRPGSARPQLDRLRQTARSRRGLTLTLPELGTGAVLELAGRELGGTPGPHLAERIEPIGGNPRCLIQVLDTLKRAGAVAVERGTVELSAAADERAPRSASGSPYALAVAKIVAARLESLSQDTRELLRSAALLGPDFAVAELSGLVGRPVGALAAPVQEAVADGVLEPVGTRLRFRHSPVRQSLYGSVPPVVRTRLNRAAVEALMDGGASVERAAQLVLDAPTADAWAAEWTARHAAALRRRAPQLAADLFERVLAHAAVAGGDRDTLLDELFKAAFTLGRYERAVVLCRDVLDTSPDPRRRGPAAWVLARSLAWTGRSQEAAAVLEAVVREPGITARWHARLAACTALTEVNRGRYGEARDAAAGARREGERLGDDMAVGYALHAEAALRFLELDLQGCLNIVAKALVSMEPAPELTDLKLTLYAQQIAALTGLDRFDEAEEAVRTARAFSQRAGPSRPDRFPVPAARLAYHQGRWDDALEELEEMGGALPGAPGPHVAMPAHGIAALICVRREEADRGDRHLTAIRERLTQALPIRVDPSCALLAEAVLLEQRDQPDQALATLARVLEPSYHGVADGLLLLPALVRSALARGDAHLAEAAAGLAERRAAGAVPRHAVMVAQWCRGLLTEDRAAVAGTAGYLRSAGRTPELGHALEDLVVLGGMAGRADAVREELAEALTVYADLGATWDLRRMTGRLRRYGVRVPNPGASRPSTGWPALTETERRIALLVAEGRSNPQIAATLLLSRRTVETHVSRVLAKLGVRTRREIGERVPAEAR